MLSIQLFYLYFSVASFEIEKKVNFLHIINYHITKLYYSQLYKYMQYNSALISPMLVYCSKQYN